LGLERSFAAGQLDSDNGSGLVIDAGSGLALGVDAATAILEPATAILEPATAILEPAGETPRASISVDEEDIKRALGAVRRVVSHRDSVHRRSLAAADALAVVVTLLIVTGLLGARHELTRITVAILAIPLMVVMAKLTGLYDRQESLLRKSTLDEAPLLFQLATLYTLIFWLMNGVLTHTNDRRALLMVWITLVPALLIFRQIARRFSRLVTPAERCVVIGERSTCERIRTKLAGRAGLHAKVVAAVPLTRSINVLANRGALGTLASKYSVDRIIIAPDRTDAEEVMNLTRIATAVGLKVSIVPRILEAIGSAADFDDIESIPLLTMRRFQLSWSSQLVKRALDVLVSAAGGVLLAPLWALIAIAIKLDSPGPVLFRQERVGRNGHVFEMLKFRTMVDGAHEQREQLRHLNEAKGLFKIASDPRITRVGRTLRRLSLDEVPQLYNVLRGDMSLVGPRPLVAEEDRHIRGWHRRRVQLTPGMTGHWQILGSARIPLDEMAKIDYLYVTNWSLWNDIKILLRTIAYVAARQGM
jgi:exopolysaccharide biosynthesis polyprenyl glycosylphosphotransferase